MADPSPTSLCAYIIHGCSLWSNAQTIILESMVLDHKIFCLVFYVFKNYEKMMLHLSNLLPQSHIAQSYISTNKQTLTPTQLEPPTCLHLLSHSLPPFRIGISLCATKFFRTHLHNPIDIIKYKANKIIWEFKRNRLQVENRLQTLVRNMWCLSPLVLDQLVCILFVYFSDFWMIKHTFLKKSANWAKLSSFAERT